MSQVHISSQTHTVTVNHDGGDLSYIVEKAQKLWDDTRPPDAPTSPAYGFQAERSNGHRTYADKRLGGDFSPVRAEATP